MNYHRQGSDFFFKIKIELLKRW